MQPLPPEHLLPGTRYAAPKRGFAAASVALGFFSMIVFWWKPFGMVLASVGLVLGLISFVMGNRGTRGGRESENLALGGTLICGFSLSVIVTLYFALGYLMWGFAPW